MKTEKWSGLKCARLFLPLVTSTISPTFGAGTGSSAARHMEAPQPRAGMVGHDCHERWHKAAPHPVWLCRRGHHLCMCCSSPWMSKRLGQAAGYWQWRWLRWPQSNILWQSKGKKSLFIWFCRRKRGTKVQPCSCCVWSIQIHWVLRKMGFWVPTPAPASGEWEGCSARGWAVGDPDVGHALPAGHHPTGPEQTSRAVEWQQQVLPMSQGQTWSQTHLQGLGDELQWAWGGARIFLRHVAT